MRLHDKMDNMTTDDGASTSNLKSLLIASLIFSRTPIQNDLFLDLKSILRINSRDIKCSREFNSYGLFLSGCHILIRKKVLQLGATSRTKTSGSFIRNFPTYGVHPLLTA